MPTCKAILLIPFLLLPFIASSQGTWEKLDVPTTQALYSVYFTDSLYGWIVGDTGTILHTTDGGESWVVQDSQTENGITSVFFLDRDRGWAVSWNFTGFYGTLILKTTDGGEHWNHEPYPDENIFMNCILFLDSLTGWMGGTPHAIVKTIDGGLSWTQAAIDTNVLSFFPVLKIKFYDENYGYACGGMFDIAGVTWSTSNGGELWNVIDNSEAPADEVHGLHIYDSITVLGAGGDPDFGYGVGMLRTEDGGMNWNYEELSMQGNAYDLDFRTLTEAWAPLGPRQKFIYSLDAGNTWTEIPTPGPTAIFDVIFPDTLYGFAVGYHGAVLRYDATSVGLSNPLQESMKGLEIYPNPCSNLLRIRSVIQDPGSRILKIYDIRGQEVLSLILENDMVDVSRLSSGIYIVKVQAEDGFIFRKIIVR